MSDGDRCKAYGHKYFKIKHTRRFDSRHQNRESKLRWYLVKSKIEYGRFVTYWDQACIGCLKTTARNVRMEGR